METKKLQLVLPKSYRAQAIRGLHDDMGHLGRDRTLNLLRYRFFWSRMATDVDDWVHKCTRCIMRKAPSHFKEPLVNTAYGASLHGLHLLGNFQRWL